MDARDESTEDRRHRLERLRRPAIAGELGDAERVLRRRLEADLHR